MSVVEANQSLPVRPVQSEGIVQTLRLLRGYRHSHHHESTRMAALRVDDQNLTIQIEKHIEGWIVSRRHHDQSSY